MELDLANMTRDEKLRAMEALWEDLSRSDSDVVSPAWHVDELLETRRKLDAGETQSMDWEDAKRQLRSGVLLQSPQDG